MLTGWKRLPLPGWQSRLFMEYLPVFLAVLPGAKGARVLGAIYHGINLTRFSM